MTQSSFLLFWSDFKIPKLQPAWYTWFEQAEKIVEDRNSDSTKSAYSKNLKAFKAWCQRYSADYSTPSIATLLAYGTYCAIGRGNIESTIRQKFTAINSYWIDNGYKGTSFLKLTRVKHFLKGVLRRQGGKKSDIRQPITAKGLMRLFCHLSPYNLEDVRAMSWMSLAYTGSFRIGEWTAIRWNHLTWRRDNEGV